MMGILAATAGNGEGAGGFLYMMVIWVVVIGAMMYFTSIRPQKREQRRMAELLGNLELGDSVLTTSGFYGVVIDITEQIVVVEFGNNKNCRIPMKKTAIVNVEKAGQLPTEPEKK